MTPLEGERYLAKSIMRSIEHCTGDVPRNRSIWPTVLSYLAWTTVVVGCITLSIYNGG